MSTQDVRHATRCLKRRKMLDLNVPPPTDNREQEGTSVHTRSQFGPSVQQGASVPPPIDLEAYDDDVIISSASAFAEAKSNSRRTRRRTAVVDVDSEGQSARVSPNNPSKRTRVPLNQTSHKCHLYINLEGSCNAVTENIWSVTLPSPPPPPPQPKEPTFSCPVCMGPLVEEMSTKCGHIFCKACIKKSIAKQSKCPTCRRKISMKDTIRVYLPTTN